MSLVFVKEWSWRGCKVCDKRWSPHRYYIPNTQAASGSWPGMCICMCLHVCTVATPAFLGKEWYMHDYQVIDSCDCIYLLRSFKNKKRVSSIFYQMSWLNQCFIRYYIRFVFIFMQPCMKFVEHTSYLCKLSGLYYYRENIYYVLNIIVLVLSLFWPRKILVN